MKALKEIKAQTAVEFIALLAIIVLVAVIIGLYLKSIPPTIHSKAVHKTENIINAGF